MRITVWERKRVSASKIAWGLLIIAIAVFCILQALGVLGSFTSVFGEISIWKLLVGICLLSIVLKCLFKLEIEGIFVPLGFLFMLFEKNIAFACGVDENIINNWLVFGCSLLLSIGFGMLLPKRRKKYRLKKNFKVKNGHIRVETDDDKIEVEAEDNDIDDDSDDDFDDDDFDDEDGDFGSANTRYFDGATFKRGYVMINMGATDVRFENPDKYQGGGILKVECKMGAMSIYVPDEWRVVTNIENVMGAVDCDHRNDDPNAPVLTIIGKCKMGSIDIE